MLNIPRLKGRIIEKYGSQGAFAKKIGRTQAFISKVMNGQSMLNQNDIIVWASALDIKIDEIGTYFFCEVVPQNVAERRADETGFN